MANNKSKYSTFIRITKSKIIEEMLMKFSKKEMCQVGKCPKFITFV